MYALQSPRTVAVQAPEVPVCAWLDFSAMTEVRRLLESVSLSSGTSDSAIPLSRRIVWHEVSDLRQLRMARNAGINRLMIEPGFLPGGRSSDSRRRDALPRALSHWKGAKVVLIAQPISKVLHEIHALASAVPSSLVLLGVDGVDALERALCLDELDKPFTVEGLLRVAEQWPRLLRAALPRALMAPDQWPVKKLAAAAGLSTRTVERYFAAAGLPSPSAALSSARARHDEQNK